MMMGNVETPSCCLLLDSTPLTLSLTSLAHGTRLETRRKRWDLFSLALGVCCKHRRVSCGGLCVWVSTACVAMVSRKSLRQDEERKRARILKKPPSSGMWTPCLLTQKNTNHQILSLCSDYCGALSGRGRIGGTAGLTLTRWTPHVEHDK